MTTNLQQPISHSDDTDSLVDLNTPDILQLTKKVESLGDWFHNINLDGVPTAPNHFLGDYPNIKWKHISSAFPDDLKGASVLDVGCNAGFYSIALKQRGAGRVLGVDVDDRYLDQGRFAAQFLHLDIEFEKRTVYEVDSIEGQFDYVLFMGVFYHLRYPLLALDKIVKKVAGRLIFQTMLRGSKHAYPVKPNYDFWNKKIFTDPDFPAAYFIENSYSNDQTNWFIPNRSGAEGMLRSAGLEIVEHPEPETWVCVPNSVQRDGRYILDMELDGTL
ncbi:MAG: Methyltransferase type 11 [Acidobacteriales bacterium]|nr:Methyltransferase type 11 [Terriglobales bacterium]